MKMEMLGHFIEGNCKQGRVRVSTEYKVWECKSLHATLVMEKQRLHHQSFPLILSQVIPKSLKVCFQSSNVLLYTFLYSYVFLTRFLTFFVDPRLPILTFFYDTCTILLHIIAVASTDMIAWKTILGPI